LSNHLRIEKKKKSGKNHKTKKRKKRNEPKQDKVKKASFLYLAFQHPTEPVEE